jgi:hypothetical protein
MPTIACNANTLSRVLIFVAFEFHIDDIWFAKFRFLPYLWLLVTYAYRMHIQDGGMHAAFDQNKSIYFENQAKYGIIVK